MSAEKEEAVPRVSAGSYHTHNRYCDGDGHIEQYVDAAVSAGLSQLGISSHMPLPFETEWCMSADRLDAYVRDVDELRERYRDRITIRLGGEIDYIPDDRVTAYQRSEILPRPFEYFVGSVHFLGAAYPPRSFDGTEDEFNAILHEEYDDDMSCMVSAYYQRMRAMLGMSRVRIVGHLDVIKRWNAAHRYFTGMEPWYRGAVEETLDAIAHSGHIVELNTAGWKKGLGEPYPSPRILHGCRERNIPIIVNSDAHVPEDVTRDFTWAHTLLHEMGITPLKVL